jgi:hypothetical protein
LLQVPSNQELLNYFSPAPDPQYALYWFFANVQQLLERSLMGTALNAGAADIEATFKPFPWPAVKIDLGGSTFHQIAREAYQHVSTRLLLRPEGRATYKPQDACQ